MIRSFKHRGLKRLFMKGMKGGIDSQRVERLELILSDLNAATTLDHLQQPSYRLHRLKGALIGHYAIDVSANWRVVFKFEAGIVLDVDLIDYH